MLQREAMQRTEELERQEQQMRRERGKSAGDSGTAFLLSEQLNQEFEGCDEWCSRWWPRREGRARGLGLERARVAETSIGARRAEMAPRLGTTRIR